MATATLSTFTSWLGGLGYVRIRIHGTELYVNRRGRAIANLPSASGVKDSYRRYH